METSYGEAVRGSEGEHEALRVLAIRACEGTYRDNRGGTRWACRRRPFGGCQSIHLSYGRDELILSKIPTRVIDHYVTARQGSCDRPRRRSPLTADPQSIMYDPLRMISAFAATEVMGRSSKRCPYRSRAVFRSHIPDSCVTRASFRRPPM